MMGGIMRGCLLEGWGGLYMCNFGRVYVNWGLGWTALYELDFNL